MLIKNEYLELKQVYDTRIKKAEQDLEELNKRFQSINGKNNFADLEKFKKFYKLTDLTREIALELIDKILIDEKKNIKIFLKFQNEYDELINIINSDEFCRRKAVK